MIFPTKLISCSILFTLAILASCSSVDKIGLGVTSRLAANGSINLEKEALFEVFESSALANLKFLEGLLENDPDNQNLLYLLSRGYGATAYGLFETKLLEAKLKYLQNKNLSKNLKRNIKKYQDAALSLYSKSIYFSTRYLEEEGLEFNELLKKASNTGAVQDELDDLFGTNPDFIDLELVFSMAQSLGSLINLQKGNMKLIASLPLVKSSMDWVCSKKPELYFGACSIFYGSYEAGKPKFMGGDPAKGRDHFLKGMKKFPANKLIPLAYIEHYLIPLKKEKEFNSLLAKLDRDLKLEMTWSPFKLKEYEKKVEDRLNLYNAIARKRKDILLRYKKYVFK